MSISVSTFLSTLAPSQTTSPMLRARRSPAPPGVTIGVLWMLCILVAAPHLAALGVDVAGPRIDAAPCATGPVIVPTASIASTALQGPTILDLRDSGILEISTVDPKAGVGLTLSPCSSTAENDDLAGDLPGLVLSAGPTHRTVWIHRPGRWMVRWAGAREASAGPSMLETRFTPWRELGEIDLLSSSLDPTVGEVALLSRWTPAAPEQSFDKEEDHEVDPDPSSLDPSEEGVNRSDRFLLQLGRRMGTGDVEPLGWILFFALDVSAQGDITALSTREEDHEVDPDPSVTGASPIRASTLWNAWVVPANDGEALWLQWREATPSSVASTDAAGSRIVSRALDLTHWLDPVVDSDRTLSIVPTRVLPWHLGPSILGARR